MTNLNNKLFKEHFNFIFQDETTNPLRALWSANIRANSVYFDKPSFDHLRDYMRRNDKASCSDIAKLLAFFVLKAKAESKNIHNI